MEHPLAYLGMLELLPFAYGYGYLLFKYLKSKLSG